MTAAQAIGFYLFAVVAAITPGPSNLIVTSTGAAVGIVRGLPALAGVAVGMGAMMFLVAFGLGSLVLGHPPIILLLKVGGVGFLLWLAWKIATAGHSDLKADKQPVGFWGAAAFQWVNPKSWLVSVSAVGTYLHPQTGSAAFTQSILFGLLFVLAAVPSCFIWLAFGASMQHLLRTERAAHVFNVTMAVLLVAAVVLFIV
jgi:threonine/homoserine/homoserine lactone efflux protein